MSDKKPAKRVWARRLAVGLGFLAAVLVAVGAGATVLRARGPDVRPPSADVPRAERAPDGVRIRVAVLNASKTRGLARRATLFLRDRGYDVVEMSNAGEQRDSTIVIDASNHPEWAARVGKAFGGARVEARPDSSRYLDIIVLVGATWRPPAKPFYP